MEPYPLEPFPAIAIEGINEVNLPAGGQVLGNEPLVEGNRFRRRRAVAEVNSKVATVLAEGFDARISTMVRPFEFGLTRKAVGR